MVISDLWVLKQIIQIDAKWKKKIWIDYGGHLDKGHEHLSSEKIAQLKPKQRELCTHIYRVKAVYTGQTF